MDRARFGPLHRRVITLLGSAMVFDAFDVYVVSVVAVAATSFRITDATLGFIVSASYVGQLVGSLLLGYMSERIGRKWAVIASLLSFGLMSLAAALSPDVTAFVWMRVLQGIGIGALPPIAGAMCSEFLPSGNRGKIGMLFQALYPAGAILSPLLGLLALQLFDSDTAWRVLFVFGGVPLLLGLVCISKLPESPRWLATKERWTEAEEVVAQLEGDAPHPAASRPTAGRSAAATRSAPGRIDYAELFSAVYWRRTILMWVQSFTAFFVVNSFTSFLPRLYVTVGGLSRENAFVLSTVFAVLELLFVIGIAFVWDRTGRKPWFVAGYALAVVGAGTAWAAFALLHSTGWIVLATAGVLSALGTYVSVGGAYLYHPELFPTRIRSWATSTGRAARSLASIVAPVALGQILVSEYGVSGAFAMFFFVSLVGLITMVWLGVETKSRSLEQIAR
jgi:putative MFS transporter